MVRLYVIFQPGNMMENLEKFWCLKNIFPLKTQKKLRVLQKHGTDFFNCRHFFTYEWLGEIYIAKISYIGVM